MTTPTESAQREVMFRLTATLGLIAHEHEGSVTLSNALQNVARELAAEARKEADPGVLRSVTESLQEKDRLRSENEALRALVDRFEHQIGTGDWLHERDCLRRDKAALQAEVAQLRKDLGNPTGAARLAIAKAAEEGSARGTGTTCALLLWALAGSAGNARAIINDCGFDPDKLAEFARTSQRGMGAKES